jgi:hypothetical protein
MGEKTEKPLSKVFSRRIFTRGAALAAAAAALPVDLLPQTQLPSATTPASEKPADQTPKLSAESQAEAEAKIQNILRKYGSRLSDAEKADLRKLVLSAQEPLEKLRAFPLENWDEPALLLSPVVEGNTTKAAIGEK